MAEARAYLDHPVLGPRLRECARLVNQVQGRSAEEIFGRPDNMKVRSSMTLFARAGRGHGHLADLVVDFVAVLDRYYDGVEDPETVARLGEALSKLEPCRVRPHAACGLDSATSPTTIGTYQGKPQPRTWRAATASTRVCKAG